MTESQRSYLDSIIKFAALIIPAGIAFGLLQQSVAAHSTEIRETTGRVTALEIVQARSDARWESIQQSLSKIERKLEQGQK
jgi:hypothetical protein